MNTALECQISLFNRRKRKVTLHLKQADKKISQEVRDNEGERSDMRKPRHVSILSPLIQSGVNT